MDDPWRLIATERRALADLLDTLTPEQWRTPSLCGEWTVREVAVHTMVGPTATMREFAGVMLRARGRFDVANRLMVDRRSDWSDEQICARLRELAEHRFTPPGYDWHAPLTDVLVHRDDIAVPLGIAQDRPAQTWRHALDFLVTSKAEGAFRSDALPDVQLVATDVDWSHGTGRRVEAPAAAIGLALCGRPGQLNAF